jgi:hypothetical protein
VRHTRRSENAGKRTRSAREMIDRSLRRVENPNSAHGFCACFDDLQSGIAHALRSAYTRTLPLREIDACVSRVPCSVRPRHVERLVETGRSFQTRVPSSITAHALHRRLLERPFHAAIRQTTG